MNSKKDCTKSYGTEMSEDILAYRLLKSEIFHMNQNS